MKWKIKSLSYFRPAINDCFRLNFKINLLRYIYGIKLILSNYFYQIAMILYNKIINHTQHLKN